MDTLCNMQLWDPENIKGSWPLQMKHNFDTLTRQGDMKLDKENIRKLNINLWIHDKILNF